MNSDLFMQVGLPGNATTLAAPGYTDGDDSINVESTTNWEDGDLDTGVIFAIDKFTIENNQEKRVAGSLCVFSGVVGSATSIENMERLFGTPQDYDAGVNTRVYITVSSLHTNRVIKGILEFANQDGTLKSEAVREALSLGTEALNGWNVLGVTPNSIAYNGQRSYSLTFNSQDLRPTLSEGMRVRTTRSNAAPVQCSALNGTNQFWSKSSPVAMTFNDDFSAGVWVKLDSYPSGNAGIISRFDGSSGWRLIVNSAGQVYLDGFNGGAANFSSVSSVQSLPLGRWVHIAAQIDMSAFITTSTTSYVMLDGVDVPAAVSRGGTNPTALVQAGNLEIGSFNGTGNFPGKIAQAAVFGAKVPQASWVSYQSQGLTGAEADLISAYSFAGNANDLNANDNDLTANNSASASNADGPFGSQASGAVSASLDYGIITKVSFSTNTVLTVQVPEGCTIPTTGGVSAIAYSSNGVPYGMPRQAGKWRVLVLERVGLSKSSPVANTWYNLGGLKLPLPIGEWDAGYNTVISATGSGAPGSPWATLSVSDTTESDSDFTTRGYNSTLNTVAVDSVGRIKPVHASAAASLYMLLKTDVAATSLASFSNVGSTMMYADNAYL